MIKITSISKVPHFVKLFMCILEKFSEPIYFAEFAGTACHILTPFICKTKISIIYNGMWLPTVVDYIM